MTGLARLWNFTVVASLVEVIALAESASCHSSCVSIVFSTVEPAFIEIILIGWHRSIILNWAIEITHVIVATTAIVIIAHRPSSSASWILREGVVDICPWLVSIKLKVSFDTHDVSCSTLRSSITSSLWQSISFNLNGLGWFKKFRLVWKACPLWLSFDKIVCVSSLFHHSAS